MKNGMARFIAEIYVIKADITHERYKFRTTFVVRPLPGPLTRHFVISFYKLTIDIFGVDESDVSLIVLRLFIHKLEDTFSTCKTHNNRVDLLRDLANLPGKLLGHVQERYRDGNGKCETRNRQVRNVCFDEDTTNKGHDNVH